MTDDRPYQTHGLWGSDTVPTRLHAALETYDHRNEVESRGAVIPTMSADNLTPSQRRLKIIQLLLRHKANPQSIDAHLLKRGAKALLEAALQAERPLNEKPQHEEMLQRTEQRQQQEKVAVRERQQRLEEIEPHQAPQSSPNLEQNSLEDAVRRGDILALIECRTFSPEDKEKILMLAIEAGRLNIVEWLVGSHGLFFLQPEQELHMKALTSAIKAGQVDIVKWLMTPKAADRGYYGISLLSTRQRETALRHVIKTGQFEMVKWLGISLLSAVQRKDVLRDAIRASQFDIVQWLLTSKVDGGCELLSLEEQESIHLVLPSSPLRSEQFEMVKWLTFVYGLSAKPGIINETLEKAQISQFISKLSACQHLKECQKLFKTLYDSQPNQYHSTLLMARQPLNKFVKDAILDLSKSDIQKLQRLYDAMAACRGMSPEDLMRESDPFIGPTKLKKLREEVQTCMTISHKSLDASLKELSDYVEDLWLTRQEMEQAEKQLASTPKEADAQTEAEPLTKLDEAVIAVETNVDIFLRTYDEYEKTEEKIDQRYTLLNDILKADQPRQEAKQLEEATKIHLRYS